MATIRDRKPTQQIRDRKGSINKKPNETGGKSGGGRQSPARMNSPSKQLLPPNSKKTKYPILAIHRENFDILQDKCNITEIEELPLKYVLKCIQGVYKNRFLFITTHPDGEIFGSGDAKTYGLTLQIEGAGLDVKHAQLRFDGFKGFHVMDFGTQSGTWMNIPEEGVEILEGGSFTIGSMYVTFNYAERIDEIQEVCQMYHINYLSDVLQYNGIRTLKQLYIANSNNYESYPFDKKQKEKLKRICDETKSWYKEDYEYRRLNIKYHKQPLKELQIEMGWQDYSVSSDPEQIFMGKNPIAHVKNYRLVPETMVFSKLPAKVAYPLSLHSQLKIGELSFELTRFNSGWGEDIGFRKIMEDGLVIEEDLGGSEWKLMSLFCVIDGHGGPEAADYIKQNLKGKLQGWSKMLDSVADINEVLKILMTKTYFELDWEFQKKYPELSMTCGATMLTMVIIGCRVFVFNLGDCKGYLFRKESLYQLNIQHKPTRGDERIRIEKAGGFVQYDRLMGKCMLSRCIGQFEYKNLEDYENQMKGPVKSLLSCIPDVVAFDLNCQTDEFILLTTDGILEVMNIIDITDYIRSRYDKLEMEENPNKIVNGIIEQCKVLKANCDNMAAILIILKKGTAATVAGVSSPPA